MMHLNVTTNQEAFDKVVAHLAAMKERSATRYGACLYRGPNGAKCAAGALIDDFEGSDAGSVKALVQDRRLDIGDVSVDLIRDLQRAHDESGNWDTTGFINWRELADVARNFELDGPTLPIRRIG